MLGGPHSQPPHLLQVRLARLLVALQVLQTQGPGGGGQCFVKQCLWATRTFHPAYPALPLGLPPWAPCPHSVRYHGCCRLHHTPAHLRVELLLARQLLLQVRAVLLRGWGAARRRRQGGRAEGSQGDGSTRGPPPNIHTPLPPTCRVCVGGGIQCSVHALVGRLQQRGPCARWRPEGWVDAGHTRGGCGARIPVRKGGASASLRLLLRLCTVRCRHVATQTALARWRLTTTTPWER